MGLIRVSQWGVLPFDCVRGVRSGGTAHFVILSGEKRRMLGMAYLKYEN